MAEDAFEFSSPRPPPEPPNYSRTTIAAIIILVVIGLFLPGVAIWIKIVGFVASLGAILGMMNGN